MTGGGMGGTSGGNGGSMAGTADASMGGSSQGGMVNLIRVRIETGDLENRLASLRDQWLTEKTRFNSYLNRKPDTEVYVNDSLPEALLPASLVILADSIGNNPMIRMLEADREANEAKITMATRMGYPMIGVGLNYSLIRKFPDVTSPMNGKDMVMPMITATLPIYRKKYRVLRQEAGFLRDVSIESALNVRNELVVNYTEALQQYNDSGRRLELFERQASLAERTITLLTASFSAAGSDFEEILRMQQQLLDYQFKKIEAQVDRNMAIATLMSVIAYN